MSDVFAEAEARRSRRASVLRSLKGRSIPRSYRPRCAIVLQGSGLAPGPGPARDVPDVADLLATGCRNARREPQINPPVRRVSPNLAIADTVAGERIGDILAEPACDASRHRSGNSTANPDDEHRPGTYDRMDRPSNQDQYGHDEKGAHDERLDLVRMRAGIDRDTLVANPPHHTADDRTPITARPGSIPIENRPAPRKQRPRQAAGKLKPVYEPIAEGDTISRRRAVNQLNTEYRKRNTRR